MRKGLELTTSQVKAYENGTTMIIVPCNKTEDEIKSFIDNDFIETFAPIQKGDKDIFIKEEFLSINGKIVYKQDSTEYEDILVSMDRLRWLEASEMTKEQSRYTISECIDVRVVRVKDCIYDNTDILPRLDIGIIKKMGVKYHVPKSFVGHLENAENGFIKYYNNQLKEQNINRTYEDNDYVFLIEAIV